MQSSRNEPGSDKLARTAGEWLVHLCRKEGYELRTLTPLEERKFDEFFRFYGEHEVFRPYHIEAVRQTLYGLNHRLTQALLEKDEGRQLLVSDSAVLQAAIKSVRIQPNALGKSPKRSSPQLLDIAKLLIEHGASTTSLDEDGHSALFYTCVLGYEELFKFLLDSGVDCFTMHWRRPPEQLPGLPKSSIEKRRILNSPFSTHPNGDMGPERVNLLQITLDALLSPQRLLDLTWIGYPPGMNYDIPIWELDIESTWGGIVLYLLRNGLRCATDDIGIVKLLHICCYQGALPLVTQLLQFGVAINTEDPRMVDETGQVHGATYGTALHAAAARRQTEVAKELLQYGADPCTKRPCCGTYRKTRDLTPLELVLKMTGKNGEADNKQSTLGFCEVLMQAKGGLLETDHIALLNFCANGNQLDYLRRLLSQGIRPQEMPSTNNMEVVMLLVKQGVPLDHAKLQQRAVQRNQLDILRWSVSQHGGMLPSDPESWGAMALKTVQKRPRNVDMLRFMISEYPGPHIDTVLYAQLGKARSGESRQESTMTSWLHIALWDEYVDAVRITLEAGANPACPGLTDDGLTSFQKMLRNNHSSHSIDGTLAIVKMLQIRLPDPSSWATTSLIDNRLLAKESIDRQAKAWGARIEQSIRDRREVPGFETPPVHESQDTGAMISSANINFPYQPLAGPSAMRLLELFPSVNPTDPLTARLVHSDITFRPDYEGVSYVWGNKSSEASLLLDGHRFHITQNLHSALVHLRLRDAIRKLWVDALCVNQSNTPERNQHVRIMGEIYMYAQQVIVWLGEAADDSHLVFSRIRDLDWHGSGDPDQGNARERRAWTSLITRPWFFRTWVIQEVALSRKAVVMCGDDSAPWTDLGQQNRDISGGACGLSHVWGNPIKDAYHPLSGIDPDSHVYYLRVMRSGGDPLSIMRYSRMCQTSDVKDKIFGILGLFKPGFIDVDYDLPVEEIFRRFTEAVIRSTGNLGILQACGFGRHIKSLPSWVPDFTTTTPAGTLPVGYFSGTQSRQKSYILCQGDGLSSTISSQGFPICILPGMDFRSDGSFVVRGKLLDTISAITPELLAKPAFAPGSTVGSTGTNVSSFASIFGKWESLAATLIPGWKRFLPSSVPDAFATTLVADTGYLGYSWDPPPRAFSEHAQGFAQWYRYCGTGVLEAADPAQFLRDVEFFMDWTGSEAHNLEGKVPEEIGFELKRFAERMELACYSRRFFVTEQGSMGLATTEAHVGDHIAYIPGAYQPFVLRSRDDGTWEMAGDCYLYGLDVFALFKNHKHIVEEFTIR
ncbi:putative Heterokaryon incompatibility protein 6, OR allele [Seiridium cardinale]|uniref:Heterokaryon incompatibility protein 6, OR allele n=1 Tax=Seiridium cardinale TaxID=138064 RepID=A0ABR2XJP2_9PEZI